MSKVTSSLLRLPWHSTTDWVASTAEMYFFPVLQAPSLRSRRRQGRLPLRPLSLAYRWLPSSSALVWSFFCVSVSQSPLPKRTADVLYQGPLIGPCFTLLPLWRPCLKSTRILRFWGLGLQHTNLGTGHHSASNKLDGTLASSSLTRALPAQAGSGRGEVPKANQLKTIAFRTWS